MYVTTPIGNVKRTSVRRHQLLRVLLGASLFACSTPAPVEVEVKVRGIEIDGEAVGSARDFRRRMRERYPTVPVRLSVLRDGDRFPLEIATSTR